MKHYRDKSVDKTGTENTNTIDNLHNRSESVKEINKDVGRTCEKTKSVNNMSDRTCGKTKSVNRTLDKTFVKAKGVDRISDSIESIQVDSKNRIERCNNTQGIDDRIVESVDNSEEISSSDKLNKQEFLRELELNSSADTIILENESEEYENNVKNKESIVQASPILDIGNSNEREKIISRINKNSINLDNYSYSDNIITSNKTNNIVKTNIEIKNKCNTALTNTYKNNVYRWRERSREV